MGAEGRHGYGYRALAPPHHPHLSVVRSSASSYPSPLLGKPSRPAPMLLKETAPARKGEVFVGVQGLEDRKDSPQSP